MSALPFAEALGIAIPVIKLFEGCHKVRPDGMIVPYICPAGFATMGWGIVVPSLDMSPITQDQADRMLEREVPKYMGQAFALSPNLVKYPRRLAAITSFIFNLGAARYKSSTLRKRVNAEDWDGAVTEILKWTRGGGRVLPGLVKRRKAEAELLL